MLWVNYNPLRFSSNNVLQVSLAVLLMAWSCNWISQMQSRAGRASSWVQCISPTPILISSLSLVLGVLGSNFNAHCVDQMPLTCTVCTMSVLVFNVGMQVWWVMTFSLCGREYVFFWGHKLKKAIARTEPSTTTSGEPVQQLKGCGRVYGRSQS
jgi:uncharacterized protein YacL